uniref:Uncharacterized protein n=1 Tax=Oryza glumipatula TaxID=40148 RepID=A0A0D9YLH1_9ORYZ
MASSGGVVVEAFTEEEHEVAAILRDLADLVRARHRRRRRRRVQREEIPSWGCRRPRTTPGEKKPAPPADVGRRHEAAASPDTPLAFLVPDESSGDDVAARAAPPRKAPASHAEWVEEQRAVVASLSQENSHLSKQIEEYRVRLQSSRSTNDGLKQMQRKLKRQREHEEEEEVNRKRRVEAAAAADIVRPAPVLDLNEPARAPEEDDDDAVAAAKAAAAAAAAAEWYHLGRKRAAMACKAAMTAEARLRRQQIRRDKAAARRAG